MRGNTTVRGEVNSRYLYVICVIIVVCVGTHHFIIRSTIGDRFDRFVAKCCRDCPDPCNGQGEPPYFRKVRLRGNPTDPPREIKSVEVKVLTQDPATISGPPVWHPITDFEPPPPPASPPLPPGATWAPEDDPDPEMIWGVQITIEVDGVSDPFVAEVKDIPGRKTVEIDALTESVLVVGGNGNPEEVFTLRLWVSHSFATGTPVTTYDDSNSP